MHATLWQAHAPHSISSAFCFVHACNTHDRFHANSALSLSCGTPAEIKNGQRFLIAADQDQTVVILKKDSRTPIFSWKNDSSSDKCYAHVDSDSSRSLVNYITDSSDCPEWSSDLQCRRNTGDNEPRAIFFKPQGSTWVLMSTAAAEADGNKTYIRAMVMEVFEGGECHIASSHHVLTHRCGHSMIMSTAHIVSHENACDIWDTTPCACNLPLKATCCQIMMQPHDAGTTVLSEVLSRDSYACIWHY